MKENIDPKTKKVALMGILAAQALALSFLENLIPAVPGLPPGAKPGLANIVTMFTADTFGLSDALVITLIKAVFAFVTRGATAFFMSLSGGILSTLVMCALMKFPKKPVGILAIAVFSALAHNAGQLAAAMFISGTPMLSLGYGPALAVFGIVTGLLTGTILKLVMPALQKQKKFFMPENNNARTGPSGNGTDR